MAGGYGYMKTLPGQQSLVRVQSEPNFPVSPSNARRLSSSLKPAAYNGVSQYDPLVNPGSMGVG